MECLICKNKIHPGEQIFWGNQMLCSGHGDYDCSYTASPPGIDGGIHLECMQKPAQPAKMPDMATQESMVGECVVRSDALGLFD